MQALVLFLQPNNAGGAALIEDVSFERNCGTLAITGPGTPGTSLTFDLNGDANAFAFLFVGLNHANTSLNFGALGTLELGLATPYVSALIGMTGGSGDLTHVINLPGAGLSNVTMLAQGLTVDIVGSGSTTTLNFCASAVEPFTISGF